MRSDAVAPVAVVGGGFSGVMTAVHLARRGVPVRLFEARKRAGPGLAYGTLDPVHVLNVPAARMSAFADEPDHFRYWADVDPGLFAERRLFGRYLEAILAGQEGVELVPQQVTALRPSSGGFTLALADGHSSQARAVVLALGNEPPAPPPGWEELPLLADPWSGEGQQALAGAAASGRPVLLVGTGLTMVDVALTLERLGHRGEMLAVSRRGLLPRAHGPFEPAPVAAEEVPHGHLLSLWRWLRKRSANVGFGAAVDSLRPHTAGLWRFLDEAERRRFLRHARPWWDVHRHRIAPSVADRLRALIAEGRLTVMAGRPEKVSEGTVTIARRGGGRRTLAPAPAVNCTGPLARLSNSANPLLRDLLGQGLVQTDPLDLGLLADAEDRVAEGLWAVGPLTKGMYWEMVAVPDIRGQAERVAERIAKEQLIHA
jgi:uncharacterized NAD(P)/FAD-binding protein YdhS